MRFFAGGRSAAALARGRVLLLAADAGLLVVLVLARFGQDARFLGRLFEATQSALDRLTGRNSNLHCYETPPLVTAKAALLAPGGTDEERYHGLPRLSRFFSTQSLA